MVNISSFSFKKLLSFIFISLTLAVIVIITLSAWIIFRGDITNLTTDYPTILATPAKPLLREQKIIGTLYAQHPNLGIVSIRFTNFHKINSDIIQFRFKEYGEDSWILKNNYTVDQFQPDQFFTFGIPIQSNSSGKKYYFEIQSLQGKPGDAIGISTFQPQAQFTYYFSKKDLIHHPTHLGEVLLTKLYEKFSDPLFFLTTMLVYILILISILGVRNLKRVQKNKNIFHVIQIFIKTHPIFLIISTGLLMRMLLATGPYNGDTEAFLNASTFFRHHLFNVYANTNGYNYSPLMFFVFNFLTVIQEIFKIFPWPFIWRLFLSFFDVAICYVLIDIAKYRKINQVKSAILFFLNPVSIIISGHHGQFENVAIFFLLLTVLLHYKKAKKENTSFLPKWALLTVSLLIKHIIVYQLLVFWRNELKSLKKIFIFFLLSIVVFLISFIPYWFGAKEQIIKNVFMYGGVPGDYGITYFIVRWLPGFSIYGLYSTKIYMYIFMISLFAIPLLLVRKDILRNMLFMFLFFLSFTSGIGIQYFVLPIALGALFPTKWFFLYTIIVSLAYVGGLEQFLPFHVHEFSFISFNIILMFALLWFLSEFFYLSKSLKILYDRYILS